MKALIARAMALFSSVEIRMYAASVIGRLRQREPFGARRNVVIAVGQPALLASNNSKARALLVYAQFFGTFFLSDSPSAGTNNIVVDTTSEQDPGSVPLGGVGTFVLRPDEQLFASALVAGNVIVGQEWY